MKRSLIALFALLTTITGFTQERSNAPFKVDYLSANQTGQLWAFGEGGSHGVGLYVRFNEWEFIEYDLSKGVIAAASVHGQIVVANKAGEIHGWNNNNNRWFPYRGISEVKDVFISKKEVNNKYALGSVKQADGTTKVGLWRVFNVSRDASSWEEILTDSWASEFIKATDDVSGNLYFVTSSGRLMARYANDTRYAEIDTEGKFAIDVLVGDDGELYMTERGGGIYKKNKSTNKWMPTQFSATSFGVDYDGNIYGAVGTELQGIVKGTWSKISVVNPNLLDGNGNTSLTAAINLNDLNAAKEALDNGTGINAPNRAGEQPIILAVKQRNTGLVNMLVNSKADLTVKDKSGHTALYYAVQSGVKELAQAILLGAVDPNVEDAVTPAVQAKNKEMVILLANYKANLSPGLDKAAELNDYDLFKTLIDYGGKINSNKAFEYAVDRKNMDIAKLCLENGSDKKAAIDYAIRENNKEVIGLCLLNGASKTSAINYAISKNDVDFATSLITTYGVKANDVMDVAVPGGKSNSTSSIGVNMNIATTALQNGAKADNYLKHAVLSKNKELIDLLLLNGGSADKLLSESVEANNVEYVTFAIDNGAKVNNDKYLMSAIENNRTEMAKLLIVKGTPVSNSKLIKGAVNNSNLEITKILLENGAPTEDKNLIKVAVTNDKEGIVQELLNYGADPNAAIQMAVDKNSTKITLMMLEAGALATNESLISKAASNGNLQIVTELVQRGAAPNDGVKSSISSGKNIVFNYLMANGGDATKIDYVVTAVKSNRVEMFKFLISRGAPVAYKNANNQNLLHFACGNDSYQIAEILIQKGVDVNQKNSEGKSPLHIAVTVGRNNIDLSTLLINNGANINEKDNKGKSILKVADGKKLKDYLKSKGAVK